MEIGDLYIDPADDMIMVYMGGHPSHRGRHVFYCSTTTWAGTNGDNTFYYDDSDLKYLEKVKGISIGNRNPDTL